MRSTRGREDTRGEAAGGTGAPALTVRAPAGVGAVAGPSGASERRPDLDFTFFRHPGNMCVFGKHVREHFSRNFLRPVCAGTNLAEYFRALHGAICPQKLFALVFTGTSSSHAVRWKRHLAVFSRAPYSGSSLAEGGPFTFFPSDSICAR